MDFNNEMNSVENLITLNYWRPIHDKSMHPPEILYHYTDAAGLQGILCNKSVWATHALYLNDPHEMRHGQVLYQDALSRIRRTADGDRREFFETCNKRFELIARDEKYLPGAYCCSLSEKGDDLSQYRAYSDGGSGYCIGFSTKHLKTAISRFPYAGGSLFQLIKLDYGENEQRALMDDILHTSSDHVVALLQKHQTIPRATILQRIANTCLDTVMRVSSYFKQEGYKDEAEWRIIPVPSAAPRALPLDSLLKTRIRHGEFVPYLDIPICVEDEKLPALQEIWIGPKLSYDRAYNGLLKNQYFQSIEDAEHDVRIVRSSTALR